MNSFHWHPYFIAMRRLNSPQGWGPILAVTGLIVLLIVGGVAYRLHLSKIGAVLCAPCETLPPAKEAACLRGVGYRNRY
jgi:hypothetical protein